MSANLRGSAGEQAIVGSLKVDAPDSAAFLSQLGLEALPLPGFGPGRLAIDLDGRFGQGAAVKVSGLAAGVQVTGEGRLGVRPGDPEISGTLVADTPDIGPLIAASRLAGARRPRSHSAADDRTRGPCRRQA